MNNHYGHLTYMLIESVALLCFLHALCFDLLFKITLKDRQIHVSVVFNTLYITSKPTLFSQQQTKIRKARKTIIVLQLKRQSLIT